MEQSKSTNKNNDGGVTTESSSSSSGRHSGGSGGGGRHSGGSGGGGGRGGGGRGRGRGRGRGGRGRKEKSGGGGAEVDDDNNKAAGGAGGGGDGGDETTTTTNATRGGGRGGGGKSRGGRGRGKGRGSSRATTTTTTTTTTIDGGGADEETRGRGGRGGGGGRGKSRGRGRKNNNRSGRGENAAAAAADRNINNNNNNSSLPNNDVNNGGLLVSAAATEAAATTNLFSNTNVDVGGASLFDIGNIALSPFILAPPTTTTTTTGSSQAAGARAGSAVRSSSVLSGGGGVVSSHPPIFMTRMNTHLSLDGFNDDHDDGMHTGDEDHIAEQLAAGLLIDDDGEDDDDDDDDGVNLGITNPIVEVVELERRYGEEKKVSTDDEEEDQDLVGGMISPLSNNKGKMQFVKLPTGFSVGMGGNVVTEDEVERQKIIEEEKEVRDSGGEYSVLLPPPTDDKAGNKKKKLNQKKKGKNKDRNEDNNIDDEDVNVEEEEVETKQPATASDAIKKLKAQEVSIGSATKVQMKRSESVLSLSTKNSAEDGNAPVINLLGGANKKITGKEKDKAKKGKKSKGKNKALGNDEAANLKAARHFNRSVRSCVERSDPDGMAEILRDKRNHHFALDSHVLETVMKAYVMAAMFEDALYCLRNCALPGTLSTIQTERILTCLPQNLRNSSAFMAADMINALCIATEFDQPTTRTYFMRIVRGIALEFLEEATSARDRICSAPCERLVRSASCVVDARLRRGKKPTDLVVDPGHQLGVFIPDTLENRGMQSGDAVSILPYAGPYPMSAESLDRNMIEATVSNAQPLVLRLQDKGNADLHQMLLEPVDGNVYRIDKLANRMGFNRQLSAAVSVCSPLPKDEDDMYVVDRRRPSPELMRAISAMDENIDRVMMAGGNLNSQQTNMTSTAAICSEAVPWSLSDARDGGNQDSILEESRLALEKYGALEGLNASQRLAVQGAASNRLTLVQGPPGTGKTAVAIRILQHWARLALADAKSGENPSPILATSDSNIAVDNLVEGCANVGLRVVRLGRPEAIRPELLRHCIDRPSDNKGNGGGWSNYSGVSPSAFKERMKTLKNAQVVCCTCIGSGGDILDSLTFERVLVDEATQATEPAVLVPLTRGCRQLVLVGDHCQLPPTVLSTRAEEEGLGVPLFSRMVACGVPPFMLDTQYRMHPAISMFPSDLFYGGKLNDGVTPPERRPLQGFPWPREEFPVAFIPVTESFETDDGVSKANEAEAVEVCNAVVSLLEGGQCTVSDIAVVTPYAAQVRLIRRQLREVLPRGPPFVEVASTDGFQGREKEAVVFSAVRSNTYGAVGFVSDWRRINVSFTRARRALIVVGNPDTLRRGDPDTFGAWISWADAHGVNMTNPGKPRGRYEPEVLRKVRGGTTAAEMLKHVLERQQAQLKTAERQQAQAEKNAAGHIMGKEDDEGKDAEGDPQALKDDLAMLENTDGCWDDSDDDDVGMLRNYSRATLATTSSNKTDEDEGASSGPLDAWDL